MESKISSNLKNRKKKVYNLVNRGLVSGGFTRNVRTFQAFFGFLSVKFPYCFSIKKNIFYKMMPTTSQQTPIFYAVSQLRFMKRDDVRKIAAQLKVSNILSKKKDQPIDIIIKTQDRRQGITNRKLPKQDEPEDSDISELKISQRFHGKIRTFKYIPISESLIDIIQKLYITNKHPSYKLSIDLRTTFQSPKYNDSTFYIQSMRYTKFETNRLDNILKDLKNGIDTKNTEGSGWKVTMIHEMSLNISEFERFLIF